MLLSTKSVCLSEACVLQVKIIIIIVDEWTTAILNVTAASLPFVPGNLDFSFNLGIEVIF